jgi:outer membrane protein assembly factor BamB
VPNPVGVGQETLLHIGITHPLALQPQGWEGLTVSVKKPDGTSITLGPFRTDSTGGTGTIFVPDQVGTYYLQTNFPEQKNPSAASPGGYTGLPAGFATPENATMLASHSEVYPLVVQEAQVPVHPGFPMPTEYWTRPIDAQLREWYTISSSWLNPQNFFTPPNLYVPYNDDAPETAHILWTRPHTIGGLVGGQYGDYAAEPLQHSFDIGDAYEGKWIGSFIVAGKLYYQKYATADAFKEYAAVDLRTGKELWSKVFLDNRTITRAQLMYWDSYDFHGVYDYLWVVIGGSGSNAGWYAFDTFTGDLVYRLNGVPSGTVVYGPKGEILIYTVDLANGWMTLWNSTNIPSLYASTQFGSMGWGQWRPMGKTVNATGPMVTPTTPLGYNGYMWNKTIPTGLPGTVGQALGTQSLIDDRIVGMLLRSNQVDLWAISIKPGQEGQLLFKKTWQPPASWIAGNQTINFEAISLNSKDGVIVLGAREARQHYGFSAETGDYLWVTEPEIYLNWYGLPRERPTLLAYGKMFAASIGGTVYAYDIKTGKTLWTYNATDTFQEFQFSNNWWLYPLFITDGKIYYGSLEHSPVSPRPRGAPFFALDVETGQEIFRVDGLFRQSLWGGKALIGDSVIATQDTYDQRVYAIGKGPSHTTVSAPNIGVPLGGSVIIQGTVTDISPGVTEYGITARFPNGVPAVSDDSQSAWMLYVYKNFPRPSAAKGVQVVLTVLDPNGNVYDIGNATSDSTGTYSFFWKPPVPGKYTVIAQFPGSKAYWPSFAETAIGVEEAHEGTPAPTQPPQSAADMYFIPAIAGIIVAIAVVGALLALLLLKKRA